MTQLGIDIGGRSVKVAARDDGGWRWTGQSEPYDRPDAAALLAAVRSTIDGRLRHADAVGVCLPGLFDSALGVVTQSVNVPGVVGLSPTQLVREALDSDAGLQPKVFSDTLATAHDLFVTRSLKGRLFLLAIGTGVGAAVLDDGVPLRVDGNSPGHFGQLDVAVPKHDVIGPDGGAGGLEGYVGAPALERAYGSDVSGSLAQFTGAEPAVAAIVRAIRVAHAIYRPHHVLLAGGVGIRLAHLVPVMRDQIDDRLTSIARSGWTLSAGDSDFHAARGAALLSGQRTL